MEKWVERICRTAMSINHCICFPVICAQIYASIYIYIQNELNKKRADIWDLIKNGKTKVGHATI